MDEGAFYEEDDLVTATQPERNWRGIIIAVLVIASVCALIVTSVVLLTPPDEGLRVKGKRLELEDIFGPDFQPYRLNGTWVNDREWMYRDIWNGVSIMDLSNNSIRTVVSNYTFRRFNAVSFSFSPDFKYILFAHDVQKVHRYSFYARYTLYEVSTGDTRPISIDPPTNPKTAQKHSTLQLAKWSPSGNAVIMVHQGDIYYKPSPMDGTTYRITDTAVPNVVTNGIPDWLYEEEVLGTNTAMWFSNDGRSLLYLTFNDSLVGEHHILQYGNVDDPHLYPQLKSLRYPKPGTRNPIVESRVVDLRGGFKQRQIKPPEPIASQDYYITAAGWVHNKDVAIIWTTRAYNLSIISICSIFNGSCEEVYRISTEGRGWVENVPFPVFTSSINSKNFITLAPVRDGENGFFDHLVLVDTINKRSHPITHGSYDVIKVNAWDEQNKLIYFTAIPSAHPGERRFYRMVVEQPYTEHSPECLSCGQSRNLTLEQEALLNQTMMEQDAIDNDNSQNSKSFSSSPSLFAGPSAGSEKQRKKGKQQPIPEEDVIPIKTIGGTGTVVGKDVLGNPTTRLLPREHQNLMPGSNKTCSYVTNVKFSPAYSYFVLECAGPNVPFVALYSTSSAPNVAPTPSASNLRLIEILQNNDALLNLTQHTAFPQVRTFTVHMTAGHAVQVRLLLPPGLRENEITRYPLILSVYGGPGSQLTVDRWQIDFSTYLAGKKDYIVAQVDSRGSGGRGWDFQHKVYYKLGQLEAADQIEVIRYLRDSLHFIEQKKIGVFGWSFGGYLTALIMASKASTNVFQCGASIAPVSNWKLYDSAYTERYMGTPNVTDNYKGYADSDVTRNLDEFSSASKMFYLIHGTSDDNVHIQHSMMLAKALIARKILFRQQVYPDENHGLSGVKLHVHRSLEEFFEDCFRKQIPPELGTGLYKGGKFADFD